MVDAMIAGHRGTNREARATAAVMWDAVGSLAAPRARERLTLAARGADADSTAGIYVEADEPGGALARRADDATEAADPGVARQPVSTIRVTEADVPLLSWACLVADCAVAVVTTGLVGGAARRVGGSALSAIEAGARVRYPGNGETRLTGGARARARR